MKLEIVALSTSPFPFAILRHEIGIPRPDWRDIAGDETRPNVRVDMSVNTILTTFRAPAWKVLAAACTSQSYWSDFYLRSFRDAILASYPDIESRVGKPIDEWTAGRRYMSSGADVLLDFQIGINTPATMPGKVSIPHIDNPRELIAMLLYQKDPGDEQGGDLRILSAENPKFVRTTDLAPDIPYRHILTVPYGVDTGIAFLQTPHSLHDVTPRLPGPFPRLLINLIVEMKFPLFEVPR